MNIRFYELEGNEPEVLLRALLSGLRPDGVRLILRVNITSWIKKYEKAGAAFTFWSTERTVRVMCINHGNLDKQDLARLDTLEHLYNTIDEWGFE